MHRSKLLAVGLLTTAALTLAGCASSGGNQSTPNASMGGTLTLGDIVGPASFDPALAGWDDSSPYYQAVFDTLLRLTPDGQLEPMLATKWTYDSPRTTLTLTLRKGITFTDGSPLTSEVVKTNLDRFRNGTGADASALASVKDVQAPNPSTVVLTLKAPNPALLNDLARDAGIVASGKSLASKDFATNPVGSGPYLLDAKDTVSGSSYVYTRNPKYWDKTLQHYNKLVINVYTDPNSALNAIKSGAANGVLLATNNNNPQVLAAGWTINTNQINFEGLLLLDRAGSINKATGDVRVRQAINMALDRPALLKAIGGGYGTTTEQVFPASSAGFDKALDNTYPYDPAKAKALLAEAGYPNGFTLKMPTTSILGMSAYNLIAQQLESIGITVQYTNAGSPGDYVSAMLAPKYSVALMQLEQDGDWKLSAFLLAPNAVWNPFHNTDSTVNSLMGRMLNGDKTAVKQLNTYIVKQAWFAPMFRVNESFATDSSTAVTVMNTNPYPAIYDFHPKS